MSGVEQPLNLISLARSGAGRPQLVPGTPYEVLLVEERRAERSEEGRWLLLLAGELIIDLPHNDFRILRPGDGLRLPGGLEVALQPIQASVVLRRAL